MSHEFELTELKELAPGQAVLSEVQVPLNKADTGYVKIYLSGRVLYLK